MKTGEDLNQSLSQESWDAHRIQGKAADSRDAAYAAYRITVKVNDISGDYDSRDVAWEAYIEALTAFTAAKASAEQALSTLRAYESGENASNTEDN